MFVQISTANHVPIWLVEWYVQEAAVHYLPYSGSSITQTLPTYHDTECNSTVLPTVFRTPGCLFSGKGDACADEEPKDNKKGKVKTLEKIMLDKMESEMRVAAVGRHYSVNQLTSHFIGKMKTKLRES